MIGRLFRCVLLAFALVGVYSVSITHLPRFCSSGEHEPGMMSSGTAWVLNTQGNFVTANHVVEGSSHYRITYQGRTYEAYVVATDTSHDIAIVKINARTANPLPLQLEYKDGESGHIYGFPNPDVMGLYLHHFVGSLDHLTFISQFSFHGQVCAGNSGGPMVGSKGVVGVVATGSGGQDERQCSPNAEGPLAKNVAQLAQNVSVPYTTSDITPLPAINNSNVSIIYAW